MSRSGYTDDGPDSQEEQWAWIRYRGAVNSAFKGKRGQAFLKELLEALDAMPVKRLIADELESEGEFCALGVIGKCRGLDLKTLDPDDYDQVSGAFGIAEAMAREIVFMNDDNHYRITPEQRFIEVRRFIEESITKGTQ